MDPQYSPGLLYLGGQLVLDPDVDASGWIRSFSAVDGQQRWARKMPTPMLAGLTATAGDVLFTGDLNGQFMALNAGDGRTLYQFNTGGAIAGGISTYRVGREQYVAVASGNSSRITWGTSGSATVFVFGLQ
jgi:alcohol dehydrogenase (cytochrome c)